MWFGIIENSARHCKRSLCRSVNIAFGYIRSTWTKSAPQSSSNDKSRPAVALVTGGKKCPLVLSRSFYRHFFLVAFPNCFPTPAPMWFLLVHTETKFTPEDYLPSRDTVKASYFLRLCWLFWPVVLQHLQWKTVLLQCGSIPPPALPQRCSEQPALLS